MLSRLKLLLAAAALNALSWIILIPMWQYPDEQAHFAQVQFISEVSGIPINNQSFDTSQEVAISEKILDTERDDLGNNKFTYHPEHKIEYSENIYGLYEKKIINLPRSSRFQMVKNEATLNPPLYYFLASIVYKIFSCCSLFTRVFAIRIMSALIFMATIFISFKAAELLFLKNKFMALAIASVIAFKPMLVFASTGILPDTLTIFLFTVFTYMCLKIIKYGFGFESVVFLFLSVIFGAMTRQHFLIVLFIIPLVIVYRFILDKKLRIKMIASLIGFSLLLFILSFFIESLNFIHRFDYPESSRYIPNNPLSNLTYTDHLVWTIKHSVFEIWPWFWGVYRWLSLTLPPVVYQIINRLIPLSAIGILLWFFETAKNKKFGKNFHLFFLMIVALVYFFALTTFDYLYRMRNGYSFGVQGRYFFPPIFSVVSLLVVGFWYFFKFLLRDYYKYGIFLLIIFIMIFNLTSLIFVSSSYYDISNISTFVIQASQYKPLIFKSYVIIVILTASIISQLYYLYYLYHAEIRRR